MTQQDLDNLTYPDFVAAIGQENSPPGGADTVAQWRRWSEESTLGKSSGRSLRILDLACSTGFSGREFTRDVDYPYEVTGIDISEQAVDAARLKADGDPRFSYRTADAASLPFDDESFDVVLGGCNFAFITDRERAATEVRRVLRRGGLLLVSNFFYESEPDTNILRRVEDAVGFKPSPEWTAAYWQRLFERDFTRYRTESSTLAPLPRWSIASYALVSAFLTDGPQQLTPWQRLSAARRLYRIRLTLSDHRAFQGLAVEAWKKSDDAATD